MNKKIRIIGVINIIELFVTTTVFADANEVITNVSNTILSAISWFGYAIALVMLIFIGIKYVLSGANERASLKGTISLYLIGVALIVLCSTIASGIAGIASGGTASGMVNKGIEIAGVTPGDTTTEEAKSTNIINITGTDGAAVSMQYDGIAYGTSMNAEEGAEILLSAPSTNEYDGKTQKFSFWAIANGMDDPVIISKNREFEYAMSSEDVTIEAIYTEVGDSSNVAPVQVPPGQ